ncbi:hypothetical protein LJB71_07185 [Thermomonas sp. S9]|uniref:hypothetical protein n=1 Tax=Thermomonas sp. S9 TaxID=2885203 RepID=UPI00216ACF2F|nr:hypothetical protein [Thermomonas sp. S9]MCR6496023.1 hypothetical protein [Thermomonas sp. S9]
MTERLENHSGARRDALASTSRDLELELLGLRVNGAQLGLMLGVSRQAVSAAAKRGTITAPGPDGLFDARRAVREWMANTDPARVRARAMKPGAEMAAELRARVQELASEVARLRDALATEKERADHRERAAAIRAEDEADRNVTRLTRALASRFPEAAAAHADGRLLRWLDELVAVEFYGQDLAAYRADFPEDEGAEGCESAA